MEVKKQIEEKLGEVLKKITGEKTDFILQPSEKFENGDYFTNIALRLAGKLGKKPLDIAYEIKKELESKGILYIEKIEVAPPGFINFFLNDKYLLGVVSEINTQKENFGNSEKLKGRKVMVEYADPNPFKEFHIGHVYSITVGETLSRLFESQSADVMRVCYQGDVGLHVAKAIYGMMQLEKDLPDKNSPLTLRAQFLGRAYALGAGVYDEKKDEINSLNKTIYEKSDAEINKLYDLGRSWSLEYFDFLYKRLGTKFEKFYFESQAGVVGLLLVKEFLNKGVFEESDGAVIFPGEKFGLHNRVFINSLGLPTYEAKEMGLAPTKYKDFKYDVSVIITGNEVNDYFKVVLKALEQIDKDLSSKTIHISHGMVRLPSGKMSSRTGDVITGEWLIDEATSRIQKEFPEMSDETSEKVAVGAVKYALLKSTLGKDLEFNFDDSIALEGASGPYLQYTFVRTKSVIEKGKKDYLKGLKSFAEKELKDEEKIILRKLIHFPEIVTLSQEKLSPNILATYLFELSQAFNIFYQKHKIGENDFRLTLSEVVGQVIKNGLRLLGIETVERM